MLYCCSRSAPFNCMRLCCREAITRDYRWLRTTMSHKLYRLMTTFTIRGRSFHIFYNPRGQYLPISRKHQIHKLWSTTREANIYQFPENIKSISYGRNGSYRHGHHIKQLVSLHRSQDVEHKLFRATSSVEYLD
jgi:hypothetical protein